jgi:hypothetical protein
MDEENVFIAENTDTELFREPKGDLPGDYYAPSLHKTRDGRIGINVGGIVYVLSLREWHDAAMTMELVSDVVTDPKKYFYARARGEIR